MFHSKRTLLNCFAVSLALGVFAMPFEDAQAQVAHSFENIFPLEGISGYPPEEMVINCGGEFPHARARMWISQRNGKTAVLIRVANAPPNAVFTIWLKLAQPSPLTGAGVTALANPGRIGGLAAVTPDAALTAVAHGIGLTGDDGTGAREVANGFRTNGEGHGRFFARLNFPVIKGAYQFQEFDDSLAPIAIGDTPFTLRLATHCVDRKAHGLIPGVHEMFFDWDYSASK